MERTDATSFKTIAGLMIPYSLFLAALYLLAYWQPLGLMPFHYANVADLGAAALAGMATSFVGLVVGVGGGLLLGRILPDPPKHAGKYIFWTFTITSVIVIPIIWLFWDSPLKWFLIGMFASFLAMPVLMAVPLLAQLVDDDHVRPILIVAIAYIPAFMYGYGSRSVSDVLNPNRGVQIDTERSDLGQRTFGQVKYAGMLGNFHVAYEPKTKRTLLIPSDARLTIVAVKSLQLSPGQK